MENITKQGSYLNKKIYFGIDHTVKTDLSDTIKQYLDQFGEVIYINEMFKDEPYYVDIAEKTCKSILEDNSDCTGILICGTGIGMSIVANKFRGIYAARCVTLKDAQDSRIINNANVLCLNGSLEYQTLVGIIDAWFNTSYEGRKLEKLKKILKIEKNNFKS